ncbi:LamG domain-containing protein [Loktanella agnita]|uniref:LamG domain-containing protein n=1 Tax=Loktanella agnita TaxID=287097 RepID=UPI003987F9D1
MATDQHIIVSSTNELKTALAAASGGETIVLKNGNYGTIQINDNYSSMITITAENPLQATLSGINFEGASNVTVNGLNVNSHVRALKGCSDLVYTDNNFKAGIYFRDADSITVDGNEIANSYNVLTLNDVTNFRITNNDMHHAESDMLRVTGTSKYGLIENNTLHDITATPPMHPDMMQFIGIKGVNPSDIVIRGNLLYDNENTGSVYGQGIFMSESYGPGYTNMLIEDNLIAIGSPNSIYINGGQSDVLIQNNTLIPWSNDGGAVIRLTDKNGYDNSGTTVRDNVVKLIMDETGSSAIDGNYVYGRGANLENLFSGDGNVWTDFLPPSGSPVGLSSGVGAFERLRELIQNDGGTSTPTPTPTDPPTGTPTTPEPADTLPGVSDTITISTVADVLEIAPDLIPDLEEGIMRFSFNANDVDGRQGLVSRDASGWGDHLNVYLQGDTLIARFQTTDGTEILLTRDGISAGTDYDIAVTTTGEKIQLSIDGTVVDGADLDWSWTGSAEYMQIGANGWASSSGGAGFVDVFSGQISDLSFGSLTPDVPDPQEPVVTLPLPGAEEALMIRTAADVVEIAPDDVPELDTGTLNFNFNAIDTSGRQGLISRDAYGFGNHVNVYLEGDTLIARFQTEDGQQVSLSYNGIAARTNYEVAVIATGDTVALSVDGQIVDDAAMNWSWSGSDEYMQIGANGWGSAPGSAGFVEVFAGEIDGILFSDVDLPAPVPTPDIDRNELPPATAVIDFASDADVIEVAPDGVPAYDAASLSFSFNAADADQLQGLVSNDAKYSGHHLNIYLQNGNLNVRFQTPEGREVVMTLPGINAGQTYDVEVTTDGTEVALIVDGAAVQDAQLAWSWADTDQYLQIGANGWASSDGAPGYDNVFTGRISGFTFEEIAVPSAASAAAPTVIAGPMVDDETEATNTDDASGDASSFAEIMAQWFDFLRGFDAQSSSRIAETDAVASTEDDQGVIVTAEMIESVLEAHIDTSDAFIF